MGNSFVQVYLDTTPPTLELHLPTYTTLDGTELIFITSNENLSPYHEILIVDSSNVEHRYTFALQEDKKTFEGNVSFFDYSKGIATLYVRLFDEVNNQSTTYKATINILDPQIQGLKLDIFHSVDNLKLSIKTQSIILSAKERKLILQEGDENV